MTLTTGRLRNNPVTIRAIVARKAMLSKLGINGGGISSVVSVLSREMTTRTNVHSIPSNLYDNARAHIQNEARKNGLDGHRGDDHQTLHAYAAGLRA